MNDKKPIQLSNETIKAILGGATKIVLGIDGKFENEVVKLQCPIQPNQEYYAVEEFLQAEYYDPHLIDRIVYLTDSDVHRFDFEREEEHYDGLIALKGSPDQMQPHESRISKIVFGNIEAKKSKDLDIDDGFALAVGVPCESEINTFLDKQNITSEYIFLIDIKEVEIK